MTPHHYKTGICQCLFYKQLIRLNSIQNTVRLDNCILQYDGRIAQYAATAVVINSERTALALVSLTPDRDICIEMMYTKRVVWAGPTTLQLSS